MSGKSFWSMKIPSGKSFQFHGRIFTPDISQFPNKEVCFGLAVQCATNILNSKLLFFFSRYVRKLKDFGAN